jgi:glutathione S-transferase
VPAALLPPPARLAALKGAFGSAEDTTTYLTSPQQRAHFYRVTETLLARNEASGAHTVGDSPSFADAVLFTVLWDDVAAHGEDEGLMKASPKLAGFYRYMPCKEVPKAGRLLQVHAM